ncbi:ATP-dependent DNA helicase II subunit 2 [Eremomyces bilateralis CBS 781.70]|uniref:ATP-dependent DNA helicase II subunit 2 n=1 Tax=Eremomyces bilateralis CBS 781.70 TaxID=1392243 RepID=A0A6G1GF32_9PEZI|nr:ATP-dependent DNA helicase II subunit 2 [Eremomyces bilateralis CBS 781.70]KAF1816526.1 ATP-dependent DNA helicase II subunit 2 [Eremomyces bilateralis CBS 781.70]
MAEKEATVYIIDVGSSMGEIHHDRTQSDLDWAMQYVWDKITAAVATDRKTLFMGVIGLRTDGTDHLDNLSADDGYQNITIFQPLTQTKMPEIRKLTEDLHPSRTNEGDAISAIVIAIEMITAHCKRLKYKRNITLVTNGTSGVYADDLDEIANKLKDDGIELVVLGVDFDDPEYGFKDEGKKGEKAKVEQSLRSLCDACDGVYGTMAQAISEMAVPRVKSVRPVPSFKGWLTLGDPDKYDSAMVIDVERYPRVMVAPAPRASQHVIKTGIDLDATQTGESATLEGEGTGSLGEGISAIKQARSYQVEDNEAPGGKRDVDKDDLAKGYEYGRTAVHIDESDMNIVKLETKARLDVIGFVAQEQFERHLGMSRSNVIIATRISEKAAMAISAFIHALFETSSYAIARLVPKDGKDPHLVALAPSIESDYECLLEVELPFNEDIRTYRFPPLDKIVTVSGKNVVQHRYLPNDELMKSMSDYVDAMDLSTLASKTEDGEQEYAALEDTYSPMIHRIKQLIAWRAVHDSEPAPPLPENLIRYSAPPKELVKAVERKLEDLVVAASVKKVPPKSKARKRARSPEKPLSGLDVSSLLSTTHPPRKISRENAIPEFKQLLRTAGGAADIHSACQQLGLVIASYVKHSLGNAGYERAIEALRVCREEAIELEEPGAYNAMLLELKRKLLDGELGEERREWWWRVRMNPVGVIDKKVSEFSEVEVEEGRKLMTLSGP